MKYLILFVLPLLIMSADYETQKYDVVLKENNFEIRYYPPVVKAKVLSENGSNKNFMKTTPSVNDLINRSSFITITDSTFPSSTKDLTLFRPSLSIVVPVYISSIISSR